MAYTELRRGANSPEVTQLQTLLNRTGAMLAADGDFGSGTDKAVRYAQQLAGQPETGVADAKLWTWLEQQPEPSPLLPANCIAYIAAEETGGLQYYQDHTRFPHWPGGKSGITIGIGYDLRMNSADDFRALWKSLLPRGTIDELAKDIGKTGTKARVTELRALGIEIPLNIAWRVFTRKSLPAYHGYTNRAFPSLDTLPADCRTVLISLVYNRGAAVKGKDREEMRAIQQLLAAAAAPGLDLSQRKTLLTGVEDQLLAMKRLWSPPNGLIKRRQTEANLWRKALAAW